MAIYLKYPGIEGDATHEDHKGWIEIDELAFELTRPVSMKSGAAGNRDGGLPSFSEFALFKTTDRSSPRLFGEVTEQGAGKTAEIHFVSTTDSGDTYAKYTLEGAVLSHYVMESAGDRPRERVHLSYKRIKYTFTPYDDDNKAGQPISVGFDIPTGKKIK